MSLLSEAMETCRMIDKTTQPDGYGGFVPAWTPGATFDAAIALDASIQAQVAQAEGVVGAYTVTTRRNVNLQFHDVFRRESDGKVFRVTTDGDDRKTPNSAGLNMRVVSAQEWSIPTGGT